MDILLIIGGIALAIYLFVRILAGGFGIFTTLARIIKMILDPIFWLLGKAWKAIWVIIGFAIIAVIVMSVFA